MSFVHIGFLQLASIVGFIGSFIAATIFISTGLDLIKIKQYHKGVTLIIVAICIWIMLGCVAGASTWK